jgi:hypothetical protein
MEEMLKPFNSSLFYDNAVNDTFFCIPKYGGNRKEKWSASKNKQNETNKLMKD